MNRIEQKFQSLKDQNRTTFIAFIMAGDPDVERSLEILKILPNAGADIIELGMPFTDPVADGLAIQLAGQRALEAGATMKTTFKMVQDFRSENQNTPIVLMGYANPIHAYGIENFAKDASDAGVDGVIIVDLPPEEAEDVHQSFQNHRLDLIRLITPTTDLERLKVITQDASGFLYYVSITGVTGAAKADLSAIKPHLDEIRQNTDLPIAIGFGIKTPDDVRMMAEMGDAVVVGSAIVSIITENADNPPENVREHVKSLVGGLV